MRDLVPGLRRRVVIRKGKGGMWYWACTLCWPATHGHRTSWAEIIRISLPRHFAVREHHHSWVASRHGWPR